MKGERHEEKTVVISIGGFTDCIHGLYGMYEQYSEEECPGRKGREIRRGEQNRKPGSGFGDRRELYRYYSLG